MTATKRPAPAGPGGRPSDPDPIRVSFRRYAGVRTRVLEVGDTGPEPEVSRRSLRRARVRRLVADPHRGAVSTATAAVLGAARARAGIRGAQGRRTGRPAAALRRLRRGRREPGPALHRAVPGLPLDQDPPRAGPPA